MAEKTVSTTSFAEKTQVDYKGKKLSIAMIGCGGISEIQLDVLTEFPEVEIVAGVDSRSERLKVMEEKYGVKQLYSDWKKMLKEVKPDAVSICTPNGQHAPASIDSSNAGAHVITEKPMAMNPAECEKMIEAAKKAKKKLVCGFQFRFHPSTQFITRARDEGQFGNIMFMKCQALRRRGIPNWGVFGRKELQGGGPMIDIGVHVIEMAHYVMGSPKPIAASGNTWTYMGNKPSQVASMWPNWDYKTYNVEDLAIGQIRFSNGADRGKRVRFSLSDNSSRQSRGLPRVVVADNPNGGPSHGLPDHGRQAAPGGPGRAGHSSVPRRPKQAMRAKRTRSIARISGMANRGAHCHRRRPRAKEQIQPVAVP